MDKESFLDRYQLYLDSDEIPQAIHESGFSIFIYTFMAGLDNMYKESEEIRKNDPEFNLKLSRFLSDVSDQLYCVAKRL